MARYRISVGRDHGVEVKNIVGAIANEANISSRHIGDIKMHDAYSTVELPAGMPSELLEHLKRTRICQHPMDIQLIEGESGKDKPFKRSKHKPNKSNG
jgi:ATP-dependent RNA helicase DeaD